MRSRRRAAMFVVVALVALVVGGTAGMALGSARAANKPDMFAPLTTVTAVRVPAACTHAIASADTSLDVATRVADELAEHTKVMDDLIAALAGVDNGMTAHKALTQGMTSINNGRRDRRVFVQARAAYAEVRRACR